MDGHRYGAGHEVSDDKVSEGKLKEIVRTRSIRATTCVYIKNVPCLVLKDVYIYIYIYISPLLLAIVAFIVVLMLRNTFRLVNVGFDELPTV